VHREMLGLTYLHVQSHQQAWCDASLRGLNTDVGNKQVVPEGASVLAVVEQHGVDVAALLDRRI
jgi:hypothetical protein